MPTRRRREASGHPGAGRVPVLRPGDAHPALSLLQRRHALGHLRPANRQLLHAQSPRRGLPAALLRPSQRLRAGQRQEPERRSAE